MGAECGSTQKLYGGLSCEVAAVPLLAILYFKAISGWLRKFCRRHGVTELSVQGEALSVDTSAVEPYYQNLKNKIAAEGYSRC